MRHTIVVAALLTVLSLPSGGSAQPPIKRAGGPRLKTSLNAYSFNKMLADHLKDSGKGMSLFQLLDFCAEHNFDAVDPTGYYFRNYPKPPDDSYINDFKRRAFVLGLDISGTGVRTHFASADGAKRASDVQLVKDWIEVAARMGAPVLRVFAGAHPDGHSWDEVAAWLTADLKKCVAHGKKHGVIIGIQNHDDFLKTGAQTVKIVKMVDSEWFGVVVDTGALATADPYHDIATVAPFAVNWQIKTHMGGKARVKTDVERIVRIARDAGYRGYLPIETLPVPGEPYDPLARVPQALAELRSALREGEASAGTVHIVIETDAGVIEAALDAGKAPATVANFLRYVDGKFYDGGRFHRTVKPDNQPDNKVKIEVIQAGIHPGKAADEFPPIKLERTRDTKLSHKDGRISMARDGPDTATSDFFICLGDQPELDFGGKRNHDGQGFAAFGHVTKGMDVVRKIQQASAKGQELTPPIRIVRIARR